MSWNRYHHAGDAVIRESYQNFKLEIWHTNDWSGVGLFEAKTEQPIWVAWSVDGKPVMESHYFHGHDAFDIALNSNRPPRYSVLFREPDHSVTWWLDRGGYGSFTERIFYGANGYSYKHEIWYDQRWQVLDRRSQTNGMVINGQWFRLQRFDSNSA